MRPDEPMTITTAEGARAALIQTLKNQLRNNWMWVEMIVENVTQYLESPMLANKVDALKQLREMCWAADDLLDTLNVPLRLDRCACRECLARFEVQRDRKQEAEREKAAASDKKCTRCHGGGMIADERYSTGGRECPVCQGNGVLPPEATPVRPERESTDG